MSVENLGVTNFWMRKRKETELLRIVSWAQHYGIPIEKLTPQNIKSALDTFRYINKSNEND